MNPGEVIGPKDHISEHPEKSNDSAVASPSSAQVDKAEPAGSSEPTQEQQPDSNWQYSNEDNHTPSSGDTSPSHISWTASEYIAHEKNSSWYLILALTVAVGAALIFIITRELMSTIVVLLMGISFGAFAARKPQELDYVLDNTGLRIGEKVYAYRQFKSFTLMEEGAIDSIMLMPLQRFMPPLSVYFDPADEDKIMDALSNYLPYEDRKPDMVDRLMRRVRF